MRTFLTIFAVCIFCLGIYDVAMAGGGIHHNNVAIAGGGDAEANARANAKANANATGVGVGVGIGGDASNSGNNANVHTELGLTQDIDLTENSLVNVSPALSANGVECDMESGSYSILLWSYGKSKCSKASAAWRDVEHFMKVFTAFPTSLESARQIVVARLCAVKELRKALETDGTDCKLAMMKPKKRARVIERRNQPAPTFRTMADR